MNSRKTNTVFSSQEKGNDRIPMSGNGSKVRNFAWDHIDYHDKDGKGRHVVSSLVERFKDT